MRIRAIWLVLVVMVVAGCLDGTGPADAVVRDGGTLRFQSVITTSYWCGALQPAPFPLPPGDPAICGSSTTLVPLSIDTVRATIAVRNEGTDSLSRFRGALRGTVATCWLVVRPDCVVRDVTQDLPISRRQDCVVVAPDRLPDCRFLVSMNLLFDLPSNDTTRRGYQQFVAVVDRNGVLEPWFPEGVAPVLVPPFGRVQSTTVWSLVPGS